MFLGAVFGELGAVFRSLKVGLFISRGQHWRTETHHYPAGCTFCLFTLLLFTFNSFLLFIIERCIVLAP